MLAVLCLFEVKLGASDDYLMSVLDEVGNTILQREKLGTSVNQGNAVDAETCLQRSHLEEFVQHYVGIGITLDVYDNTHSVAVTFVIDIADTFQAFLCYQTGNILDEFRLVDAIGDF